MELYWLPKLSDWNEKLGIARSLPVEEAAPLFVELANSRVDFLQTIKLDRAATQMGIDLANCLSRTSKVKLAIIGSSTLSHLVPAIRVAAMRRSFSVEIFEGHYGMYLQELADPNSDLYKFKPDVVLIALDAHHVAGGDASSSEQALELLQSCWNLVKKNLGATVIQQTILPVFSTLLGNNEHHFESSPAAVIVETNAKMRVAAKEAGVLLLAADALVSTFGVRNWFNDSLWHRSKQEIQPSAAPLWGDHLIRVVAALRGLSAKCLVLDLDNTLWGGVIGDDGLEGIQLGQGNAVGESYIAFQQMAIRLSQRGIILAVCSKNDEDNARAPFERHPEMLLKLHDIACFVANWQDKAANLRFIAQALNIGLDSLVFADDNPFERNLVRQELPMVSVPELPEDPALYTNTISDAGYFEGLTLTAEDRERSKQYQTNADRERMRESVTDMESYLRGLRMQLEWLHFEPVGLSRVAQLINKSNQFNLTTRRYSEGEVAAMMDNSEYLTLQLRLVDRFGDNGMIAVVIGRAIGEGLLEIDTWLMSCRVLGRQVEEATLNLIVECARLMGIKRLVGVYLPTSKNGMVREHYERLGFTQDSTAADGSFKCSLDLNHYNEKPTSIVTIKGPRDY